MIQTVYQTPKGRVRMDVAKNTEQAKRRVARIVKSGCRIVGIIGFDERLNQYDAAPTIFARHAAANTNMEIAQ